MQKPIPLPKLRSIVRSELQALDRPHKQTLIKYNKDIWIMNRKELENLRTDKKKNKRCNIVFMKYCRMSSMVMRQKTFRNILHLNNGSPWDRFLKKVKHFTIRISNSTTRNVLSVIQHLLPRMKNLRRLDLTNRIKSHNNKYCEALNDALIHLKKLTVLKL